MVKLKGPGVSMGASGTIGDVLTFSTSAKGGYAKKRTTPANPKTARQVGSRAGMSFLSKNWGPMGNASKSTWPPLAQQAKVSPYNAFLTANLERWGLFLFPSERPTIWAARLNAVIAFAALTLLQRSIRIQVLWTTQNHNWGIVIFRSTSSGFAPAPSNAIAMLRWRYGGSNTVTYVDENLPAATYYYRFRTFANRGTAIDTFQSEYSETVP